MAAELVLRINVAQNCGMNGKTVIALSNVDGGSMGMACQVILPKVMYGITLGASKESAEPAAGGRTPATLHLGVR